MKCTCFCRYRRKEALRIRRSKKALSPEEEQEYQTLCKISRLFIMMLHYTFGFPFLHAECDVVLSISFSVAVSIKLFELVGNL